MGEDLHSNGDEPADNMGVRITAKDKVAFCVPVTDQPDLGRAALDFIGVNLIRGGQGGHGFTQINDMHIAFFPPVEKGKILDQVSNIVRPGGCFAHALADRTDSAILQRGGALQPQASLS